MEIQLEQVIVDLSFVNQVQGEMLSLVTLPLYTREEPSLPLGALSPSVTLAALQPPVVAEDISPLERDPRLLGEYAAVPSARRVTDARRAEQTADQTLAYVVHYIQSLQLRKLADLLDSLPISSMQIAYSDRLLFILLDECISANSLLAADVVLSYWAAAVDYTEDTQFPIWLRVSMKSGANETHVKLLRAVYALTFLEVLSLLGDNFFGSPVRQACALWLSAFPEAGLSQFRELYRLYADVNDIVAEMAADTLREVEEFAPLPDWCLAVESQPASWKGAVYWVGPELPRFDFYEALITAGVYENDGDAVTINREAAVQYLLRYQEADDGVERELRRLEQLSEEELVEAIRPIAFMEFSVGLQDNIDLFRAYGPAHPLISDDPDDLLLGGARMLLAVEPDDEDASIGDRIMERGARETPVNGTTDWFHPNCDVCLRKIRRRAHALRRPLRGGGWFGVFCSFECLEEHAYMVDPLPDQLVFDADNVSLEQHLVGVLRERLAAIGVQDRPDELVRRNTLPMTWREYPGVSDQPSFSLKDYDRHTENDLPIEGNQISSKRNYSPEKGRIIDEQEESLQP